MTAIQLIEREINRQKEKKEVFSKKREQYPGIFIMHRHSCRRYIKELKETLIVLKQNGIK